MKKKLEPKYSGDASKLFWKRVNEIKDYKKNDKAYSLAVVLQNVEEDILRLINQTFMNDIKQKRKWNG